MSVPHLMNPLMLTASSVLRSLQRISRWALPSLDSSAAETRGLSSSGDFSSLTIHAGPAPGLLSAGLPVRLEEDASTPSEHFRPSPTSLLCLAGPQASSASAPGAQSPPAHALVSRAGL